MRTAPMLALVLAVSCGGSSSSGPPDGPWHYFFSATAVQTGQCAAGPMSVSGSMTFNGGTGTMQPTLNVNCNSGTCSSQTCAVSFVTHCTISSSTVSCTVTGGTAATFSGTCAPTGGRNNQWSCDATGAGNVANSTGAANYDLTHLTLTFPL